MMSEYSIKKSKGRRLMEHNETRFKIPAAVKIDYEG